MSILPPNPLKGECYSQKLSKNDLLGFIIVRKVAGENPANKSGTTAEQYQKIMLI